MATAQTRRVIARTPRRAAAPRSGFAADCRWCRRPILWLRSTSTDQVAPIDATPTPGGNVVVHRGHDGLPTGTYDVVQPPRIPAQPQQDALLEREDAYAGLGGGLDDVLAGVPDDDVPTRHVNHWATCGSATARRLARERADRGVPAGPLRTVDGDPVGPRHRTDPAALAEAAPDAFEPPSAVATNLRRCRGCWQPLTAASSAAGDRYHPTCGPDPGPEPDR